MIRPKTFISHTENIFITSFYANYSLHSSTYRISLGLQKSTVSIDQGSILTIDLRFLYYESLSISIQGEIGCGELSHVRDPRQRTSRCSASLKSELASGNGEDAHLRRHEGIHRHVLAKLHRLLRLQRDGEASHRYFFIICITTIWLLNKEATMLSEDYG